MRKIILSLAVSVCLAASVQAAEPFVVLVDRERGLLLVPEGSVIPKGIEFTLSTDDPEARAMLSIDGEEPSAKPQRFVYAYAPAEKFVEPKRRIAEAEAKMPESLKAEDLGPMWVTDMDQTYYYYFWDYSFHSVRKYIKNLTVPAPYNVHYMVHTRSYAANGDWDTKMTVTQSSAQLSNWNQSKVCWFYGDDGPCELTGVAYQTHSNFTGSVTSYTSMTHYFYPPCDLPCKENLQSTIVINFP